MANVVIRIDQETLNAFSGEVHGIAASIAASVPQDLNPIVDDYTTRGMGGAGDRRASSVTLRHPKAMLLQARNGLLTRAAAGQGHEVTQR